MWTLILQKQVYVKQILTFILILCITYIIVRKGFFFQIVNLKIKNT